VEFPSMLRVSVSSARTDLLIRTVLSSSSDANVSTPISSECDEGVTVHADPTVATAVAEESVQALPPSTKDSLKEEKEGEAT